MSKITAAISAVGKYLPDYILTNKELETLVETNDDWITSRTGIKERRILKEPNQGTSFMAIRAAKDLLQKSNLVKGDIYCLGAAIYTEPLMRSEYLIVTWLTMFFNAPKRTVQKFRLSIPAFFNAIFLQRKELLQFINLITND